MPAIALLGHTHLLINENTMKRKGYTIHIDRYHFSLGYLTYTLAVDGKFYGGVNDAFQADTLDEARKKYHSLSTRFELGTDRVYILGPKRGTHRVGSRHNF